MLVEDGLGRVGFRLDPEAKERGLERVLEASIELCEQPLEQGVDLGSHLWWGGLCVAPLLGVRGQRGTHHQDPRLFPLENSFPFRTLK